jgi:hypothetical protein
MVLIDIMAKVAVSSKYKVVSSKIFWGRVGLWDFGMAAKTHPVYAALDHPLFNLRLERGDWRVNYLIINKISFKILQAPLSAKRREGAGEAWRVSLRQHALPANSKSLDS